MQRPGVQGPGGGWCSDPSVQSPWRGRSEQGAVPVVRAERARWGQRVHDIPRLESTPPSAAALRRLCVPGNRAPWVLGHLLSPGHTRSLPSSPTCPLPQGGALSADTEQKAFRDPPGRWQTLAPGGPTLTQGLGAPGPLLAPVSQPQV